MSLLNQSWEGLSDMKSCLRREQRNELLEKLLPFNTGSQLHLITPDSDIGFFFLGSKHFHKLQLLPTVSNTFSLTKVITRY